MIIKLANTRVNVFMLEKYLNDVDSDFMVPLSKKASLIRIAEKALSLGHVLVDIHNGIWRGIVVFYANDNNSKEAHLSILSVKTIFRGQGIARLLTKEAIKVCKNSKMDTVKLDSVNPNAISLYQSLGFEVESINGCMHYLKLQLR